MSFDAKTYLAQVGAKSLGFDPGPLDGDEGPKTRAAFAAFMTARHGTNSLALRLVQVARSAEALHVRETSFNHGPEIAKYWTATSYAEGYANREPYCAAFICWVVREACKGATPTFKLPRSAVAYELEDWGRANAGKGVSFVTSPAPGDLFTLATASHCGLIVGVNGKTVTTVEANTDGSGSREGDGVYTRTRSISTLRKILRLF